MKIRIYDPDSQDIRTSLESIFSSELLNKFFWKYKSECEELVDTVLLSSDYTLLEITKAIWSQEEIGASEPEEFAYLKNDELCGLIIGFINTPTEMTNEQAKKLWGLWNDYGSSFILSVGME